MASAAAATALHSRARTLWERHASALLQGAAVALAAYALLKLGTELHRLLFDDSWIGAIDVLLRHEETRRWFAGQPVTAALDRLTYPPHTYLLFAPLLLWPDPELVRVLWALSSLIVLACLAALLVHESGAATKLERAFVALVVLSMNAVGVTIGNGQFGLHVLAALVGGWMLARRAHSTWLADAAAAMLLTIALVKPTLTLPFVFVTVLTVPRVRPLVLTGAAFLLLTTVASQWQPGGPGALLLEWARQPRQFMIGGYGDVASTFLSLGIAQLAPPIGLLLLAALGLWTWRRREAYPWLLMGVAALVARFWTYHRAYDDVVILLPMIALYRLAHRDGDYRAGALFAVAVAAMLAPGALERAGPPYVWLFVGGHVALWLAMLAVLVRAAARTVDTPLAARPA